MKQYDLAFIAHDAKKEDMVILSRAYKEVLAGLSLVATRNTGRMIQQGTGLPLTLVHSTQEGGVQEIGALAAGRCVKAVILLRDHMTVYCHESDCLALMRVCDVLNIPVATNTATARALLHFFCEEKTLNKTNLAAVNFARTLAEVY
jgi:methylglyoxal synthase